MAKRYKCPYCQDRHIRKDLIDHIDKEHEELIPDGFEAAQVVYDIVNNTKGAGRCRVCGSSTKWNSGAKRYDVLCENPRCKQKMREEYQKNMIKVHGTYNILTDDEQQKKMLANRSISGTYRFSDGGVVNYTGSYEKKFLEFADKVMQITSKDIMAPGPTLEYEMDGKKHFYITDFLYIPYNLIIEVKDGGSNPNNKDSKGMRSSRQRTIEKEKLITDRGEFNYLRLTDNQFVQLLEIFMEIKKALLEGDDGKIVKINESAKDNGPKECTKCGSNDIGVYLQGEPIYKCNDCGEYLGVVPFPKNESTNIFTSGDFDDYIEYGEQRLSEIQNRVGINRALDSNENQEINTRTEEEILNNLKQYVNESYVSEGFTTQLTMSVPVKAYNVKNKTPINGLPDLIKYHKNPGLIAYANKSNNIKDLEYIKKDTYTVIPSINKVKERISLCKELGDTAKTASYYKFIKKNYIDAGITEKDCDITIEWVKSFCKSITDRINRLKNESCLLESDQNLTKLRAYHLEPKIKPRSKIFGGWDEELYSKDIESAINNDIKYKYELKGQDKVSAYVYTAGKDLKAIYLGTITIFDKNTGDWEWEEQETLSKEDYDYLMNHPIDEATHISNFYEEDYE